MAGTGKSTIARTVARKYFDQKRLGASFFFSRGGGDVGHASKFFTSLAVQIAHNIPHIQQFISDAIIKQNDIANQSLRDQWHSLIFCPLSRLEGSSSLPPYILVVDALDECNDEDHIRMILQLFAEARLLKIQLRVLITSRPEFPIRHSFLQISQNEHHDFILHNVEAAVVDKDIFALLHHEMGSIGQEWALGTSWPGEPALRKLVVNASGLFIWAATACRFIREGREYAAKRLWMILEGSTSNLAPEHHLNTIYITVLKSTIHEAYLEIEKEDRYSVLKQILSTIVLLYSPLSINSLSKLLYLPKEAIEGGLANLHAILDIPKNTDRLLHLHHPSFRDFLLNKNRCNDLNFWVDKRQAHRAIANNCIRLMSKSLKQDVCEQKAPETLVTDVERRQVEQCLSPEIQYACFYWVQHLQESGAQLCDEDQVHQFLQVHLLHWLEVLGWTGKASEGILAVYSLATLIPVSFLYDILRSVD